jgi:hypothetical protein
MILTLPNLENITNPVKVCHGPIGNNVFSLGNNNIMSWEILQDFQVQNMSWWKMMSFPRHKTWHLRWCHRNQFSRSSFHQKSDSSNCSSFVPGPVLPWLHWSFMVVKRWHCQRQMLHSLRLS